jgi:hypothetical protein
MRKEHRKHEKHGNLVRTRISMRKERAENNNRG